MSKGKAATRALDFCVLVALALAAVGCQRQRKVAAVAYAPVLKALTDARQPAAAVAAVNTACSGGEQPCECAEVAARTALDADLHRAASAVLDSAPRTCTNAALIGGERAEALARAGETDTAQHAAEMALASNASNPYAELALARVAYDKNQMTACHDHAAKALQYGRGAEAARLLGRSALSRGAYAEAEGDFKRVLSAQPDDAEAAYSLGICADTLGNYLEAREAFLQTLRLNPRHVEARVHLVMLTLNAGAKDEARHNVQKLTELLSKDDPRLTQLEHLLDSEPDGGAPSNPGTVYGKY